MIEIYLGSGFADGQHGVDSRVALPVPIVIGNAMLARAVVIPADPNLVTDVTLHEWIPEWRLQTPSGAVIRAVGHGASSTTGIINLNAEFRIDRHDPDGEWELRIIWRGAEPPILRRFEVSRGLEPVRWL